MGLKERWNAFLFSIRSPMTSKQRSINGWILLSFAVALFSCSVAEVIFVGLSGAGLTFAVGIVCTLFAFYSLKLKRVA